MLQLSKEIQKALKDGTANINEVTDYLIKNNSSYDITFSLAELMANVESSTIKKVVVSADDMETILSVFRVRGLTNSGEAEYRGRKPKLHKG